MTKHFDPGESNRPRFFDNQFFEDYLSRVRENIEKLKKYTEKYQKYTPDDLRNLATICRKLPFYDPVRGIGLFRRDGSEVYFEDYNALCSEIKTWNNEDEFRVMLYYPNFRMD